MITDLSKMTINTYLKRVRQHSELSQAEFAKAIGVTQATLSNWERKTLNIPLDALKKVKKYCDENSLEFDVFKFLDHS